MGRSKLTSEARALFAADMSGIKNELALVRSELQHDCSRDEIAQLAERRKHAMDCRAIVKDELERIGHEELVEELRNTREALKQQGSGATSFDETLSIPRRSGSSATPH